MNILRILGLCAALAGGLCVAGCESDDLPDHKPPAGFGSLIVDNRTSSRLVVYLDGRDFGTVRDFNSRAIDLLPGVHRLVLEPDDSFLSAVAADVDILEGRRTVAEAATRGTGSGTLALSIYLD